MATGEKTADLRVARNEAHRRVNDLAREEETERWRYERVCALALMGEATEAEVAEAEAELDALAREQRRARAAAAWLDEQVGPVGQASGFRRLPVA